MIYLLLADGFEEIEALTPLDMLRRVGMDVKTVSIMNTTRVVGAHGIAVEADILADEAGEKIDMLILPGGMPGAKHLDESPVTEQMLSRVAVVGGRVAAICAAPMIFGKRGLLRGKDAICYPGFEQYLEGANVRTDKAVVTDGLYTTAVGMGAAVAFGAELVRLLTDAEKAEQLLCSIHADHV